MTLVPPLTGVRIVEFEGIGPGPVAGHILQGMGAHVTLIARPTPIAVTQTLSGQDQNPLEAGKNRIVLDLKGSAADRQAALDLVAGADALIEGLRPGVMERLGLGPAECAAVNPALIYGRITGWGQTGPLAPRAGHDLNYVALSGLLSLARRDDAAPVIPPTALGDGAGALGLAFGIVCALLEARTSGKGRVVDTAIVDVAAMLGLLAQWLYGAGQIGTSKPSAFHDSPFYDVYECRDGKFITLGALEPQFYVEMLEKLGVTDVDPARQYRAEDWPALKSRIAARIREQTRDEWCAVFDGSDACFAPVLDLTEAPAHPHNVARGNFTTIGGAVMGQIAPSFIPFPAP